MTRHPKPTMHGRDHAVDGPDPVPGIGGGGIQFDTDNEGGWLYVQTNDATEAGGAIHGYGIDLFDESDGGIRLKTFHNLTLEAAFNTTILSHDGSITLESDVTTSFYELPPSIYLNAPTGWIFVNGDGVIVQNATGSAALIFQPDGTVSLQGTPLDIVSSGGDIQFGASPSDHVGFFGVTPAAQQPHPTTLADVINVLTTFGLTA